MEADFKTVCGENEAMITKSLACLILLATLASVMVTPSVKYPICDPHVEVFFLKVIYNIT